MGMVPQVSTLDPSRPPPVPHPTLFHINFEDWPGCCRLLPAADALICFVAMLRCIWRLACVAWSFLLVLARWSEDRARAWTGAWRVGASWKRREDGPKALEVNIYIYIYVTITVHLDHLEILETRVVPGRIMKLDHLDLW